MSVSLEDNKRIVIGFYETAFNDHKPEEAVEKYMGPKYTQHNPGIPDGREAFLTIVGGFTKEFPRGEWAPSEAGL